MASGRQLERSAQAASIPTRPQHPYFTQVESVETATPSTSAPRVSVTSVQIHPYFYVSLSRKNAFGLNSNRHLGRLETDVTSRKQTKEVRSNRH
jgi:hypothetical protein